MVQNDLQFKNGNHMSNNNNYCLSVDLRTNITTSVRDQAYAAHHVITVLRKNRYVYARTCTCLFLSRLSAQSRTILSGGETTGGVCNTECACDAMYVLCYGYTCIKFTNNCKQISDTIIIHRCTHDTVY